VLIAHISGDFIIQIFDPAGDRARVSRVQGEHGDQYGDLQYYSSARCPHPGRTPPHPLHLPPPLLLSLHFLSTVVTNYAPDELIAETMHDPVTTGEYWTFTSTLYSPGKLVFYFHPVCIVQEN
jgi:hypothetical protein